MLHSLGKHFERLLALHTTISERILHARYLVLLVEVRQLLVLYHNGEGSSAHLDVVMDILLKDNRFPDLYQGSKL